MSGPVFIIAATIACGTVLMIVKTIAQAFAGERESLDRLAATQAQSDQFAAALDETNAILALQATQIAELHERVDFAERLLTQARSRETLGPGEMGT